MAQKLTSQKAIGWIEHVLGGPLAPQIEPMEIVNMAGEHLLGIRSWNWLIGASASVGFVADQAYSALPTDFLATVGLQKTSALVSNYREIDLKRLLELRTRELPYTSLITYGAVVFVSTAGAAPLPRLEIWPTPTATDATAMTLYYRRGWTEPAADTTEIPVPAWCHDLFLDYCRAFAQGYEEDMSATLGQRIAEIDEGPIMKRCVRRDGAVRTSYGVTGGGAAQVSHSEMTNWFAVSSAGDPA